MLVGGGSEEEGGWSDIPYAWAVENSVNKKVAVISYADEDNFIPDYFLSLGAASAVNFKIDSRNEADLQYTYDQLMQYDVFFFKGGDQFNYYKFLKDTKTIQAIIDKFNGGGVISGTSAGMAILSGVIFTAENGSVYPDEALQDFKSSKISLAGDFLPLFPGYIFDSHFTERGRGPRLLAFMANWFVNHDALLRGIGVDDRTAFCIDNNKLGTVYGTGAVSIYSSTFFSAFQDDKPLADSVHAIQLLHGHTIDLQQLDIINGPEDQITPIPHSETGNYEVVLSGSEDLSTNFDFIHYFINEAGELADTIAIITAPGKAIDYRQKLTSLGIKYVIVETSTTNDIAQVDLRNSIRRSKKILFVENDDNLLLNFLNAGPTGILVNEHIRRNNIISGFIGEDSRYAGKVFVSNHLNDMYAAYYGHLHYERGIGLLKSTVVMSNTYDVSNTDFYENTTAAVSYAMIADSIKYGIYLNRESYLRFYHETDQNYFQAKGSLSAVVMIDNGTKASLASQPVNGAGDQRNYVGFSTMQYVLLNGNAKIKAGTAMPSTDQPYAFETDVVGVNDEFYRSSTNLFPNPSANGIFHFSMYPPRLVTFCVTDLIGRTLLQEVCQRVDENAIDLSSYPDGMYFVTIHAGNEVSTAKIIKRKSAWE